MSYLPPVLFDWIRSQTRNFNDLRDAGYTFIGQEIQDQADPNYPVPVAYGLVRIEGHIPFITTKLNDSRTLYMVVLLAEGQCGNVYRVLVDGAQINFGTTATPLPHNTITFPQIGDKYRPGTAESAKYAAFEYIDGRSGNVQSNLLKEIYPGATQPPIQFEDCAYLVCRFVLPSINIGGPPLFTALPRVTVDLFGTQTVNVSTWNGTNFSATKVSGYNPVDHLFDYLTNTRYGPGIPQSQISVSSFKTVADYITATTVKQNSTDTNAQPYLMSSGVLDTSRGIRACLEELKDPWGFIFHYTNGKYQLDIESKNSSYTDIGVGQIVSDIAVSKGGQDLRFNSIKVEYVDALNNFATRSVIEPTPNALIANTYLAQDGNLPRQNTLKFTMVPFDWQAQQLARKTLLRSREQNVYQMTLSRQGFQFTVGDIIRVTSEVPSLTNELMRILRIRIDNDFLVSIECIKHSDTFYPPYTDINYATGAPNLVFQPTSATAAPIALPPANTDVKPTPGSPGGQPTPGTTAVLPVTYGITMSQIRNNFAQPSLTSASVGWPFLGAGPGGTLPNGNEDWYAGRIYLTRKTVAGKTVTAYGNNPVIDGQDLVYTINSNFEFCLTTQTTTNKSQGLLGSIDHVAGSLYDSLPQIYTWRQCPVVTYRVHANTQAGITDSNNGKYKNASYLLFFYTFKIGTTDVIGWQRHAGNGVIETYLVRFQALATVQKIVNNGSKPVEIPWRDLLGLMPKMYWSPSPDNFNGGSYGAINNQDGTSCLQWVLNTVSPTALPIIPCITPMPWRNSNAAAYNTATAENITYYIFHVGSGTIPEPIGSVVGTNNLATNYGTPTLNRLAYLNKFRLAFNNNTLQI